MSFKLKFYVLGVTLTWKLDKKETARAAAKTSRGDKQVCD